jgi:hypothetical protein
MTEQNRQDLELAGSNTFRDRDERTVQVQQDEAIAALVGQQTVEAAALTAGIEEDVLRAWLEIPAFRDKYHAARRDAVGEGVADAIVRLQEATPDAVEALTRNLTSGIPAVEVEAARAILDNVGGGEPR